MKFEGDLAYIENMFLKHDESNNASEIKSVQRQLKKNNIDSETATKIMNGYKLAFFNHSVETSRFITYVINSYMVKDEFCRYLYIYMKQCYSKSIFMRYINKSSDLVNLFNKYYARINDIAEDIYTNISLETLKNYSQELNMIIKFYSIIEEFMIRFYSYSVFGISKQKYIVTAKSNCDKEFIDYLMQGYSLYRLQRIGLLEKKRRYTFFPVLPTKDVGFPINEFIEVSGKNNKIENKKLVKVQYYG